MSRPEELGENDIEIFCPFCGREVLHEYQQESGFDDFEWSPCEHAVFASSDVDSLFDGEDIFVATGDPDLDAELKADGDDALRTIRRSKHFKNCKVREEGGYVERGMGPRGGGPTYSVIFSRHSSKASGPLS